MAQRAANAFLQERRVRARGQPLRIVVALQQHGVQRTNHDVQARKRVAQISQDADALARVRHDKADAVDAVMRRRDGFHAHFAKPQRVSRDKVPHILQLPQTLERAGGGQSPGRDIDRQLELPLIDAQASGMVTMVVRDDHGVHRADVSPVGGESGLGLPAADAGVQQQPHVVRFDVDAISVAA